MHVEILSQYPFACGLRYPNSFWYCLKPVLTYHRRNLSYLLSSADVCGHPEHTLSSALSLLSLKRRCHSKVCFRGGGGPDNTFPQKNQWRLDQVLGCRVHVRVSSTHKLKRRERILPRMFKETNLKVADKIIERRVGKVEKEKANSALY
ncbi:hypothetical protein TNCV_1908011 [Trichonephila clavipes]|nr:hypothetical protein TNCV_1908011 [Trichonephila clavipes]